ASKGVAALVLANAGRDEPIVFYHEYLRALPFYLQRQVVMWSADFDEFGHEVGEEEARGRALLRSDASLRRLLAGATSALVLADSREWADRSRGISPAPLETLGGEGRFTLSRARRKT